MSEWPMVKLGEVISRVDETEQILKPEDETFVTLKLHGKGVVPRNIGDGKTPKSFRGFRVKLGQFIYSRIDARNGAFGIIPAELDGAVVSKDFPVYEVDSAEIMPSILISICTSEHFVNQIRSMSNGATNRQRIKEDVLERMLIPLPPLGEQKRIVGILGKTTGAISSVQKQIEQAKKLRSSIVGMASKMAVELRAISEYFDINPRQPRNIPDNAPTSFVPMANLDETFGISPIASRFSEHKKGYTYFENGDILLAKITPCFENGKSAIAKLSTQIGHGSTEFHVLRHKNHMHQDACLSPLLAAAILKQPSFLKPAENFMRGSAGQKRIPVSYIASLKVPVLKSVDLEKIDQSLEIVEALLNLYHRKLSLLQELQKSLANRAFAGLL